MIEILSKTMIYDCDDNNRRHEVIKKYSNIFFYNWDEVYNTLGYYGYYSYRIIPEHEFIIGLA